MKRYKTFVHNSKEKTREESHFKCKKLNFKEMFELEHIIKRIDHFCSQTESGTIKGKYLGSFGDNNICDYFFIVQTKKRLEIL